MHDEFHNRRHGTFFFIPIFDGIFVPLRYKFASSVKVVKRFKKYLPLLHL
jgi:hypothetical protein